MSSSTPFRSLLAALAYVLASLSTVPRLPAELVPERENEGSTVAAHLDAVDRLLERQLAASPDRPGPARQRELTRLWRHLIEVDRHAQQTGEPDLVRIRLRELIGVVEDLRRGTEKARQRLLDGRLPSSAAPTLAPGTGALLGEITATGSEQPLYRTTALLFDESGALQASTEADDAGVFAFTGLTPGPYYVWTSSFGLVPELFDDVECLRDPPSACIAEGTAINVTADDVAAISIDLGPGGTISAEIHDSISGEPLFIQRSLEIYDEAGSFVTSSSRYGYGPVTVAGLAAGTYYAVAGSHEHVPQLYSGTDCITPCAVTTGEPIVLGRNSAAGPLDFFLAPGGDITGRVTDSATGQPVPFAGVRAQSDDGYFGGSATADEEGHYRIAGLEEGSYVVTARSYFGYVAEVYREVTCPTPEPLYCDRRGATTVPVTRGETTRDIDFTLAPAGGARGTARAADHDGALVAAWVQFWPVGGPGRAPSATSVRPDGTWDSGPLGPGDYWVTADAWHAVRQLYRQTACREGRAVGECGGPGAEPVSIEAGAITDEIHFVLQPASRITGQVRAADNGLGIPPEARLVSADGSYERLAPRGPSGTYEFADLDRGTYFLWVETAHGYQGEVYDDVPCTGACEPMTGTPVAITAYGSLVTGIDFELERFGRISGTVRDAHTGEPLAGVHLRIRDSDATHPWIGILTSARTDSVGRYWTIPLPPGSYSIWTEADAIHPYVPTVYPDRRCRPQGYTWDCDDLGTPVRMPKVGFSVESIDFDLAPFTVFRDGFESGDAGRWKVVGAIGD